MTTPTAQDFLESILISVADLQRAAPEMLALAKSELALIDYWLGAIRDHILEGK